MTVRYTETQIVEAISRLTATRLTRFVQAEIVVPVQTEGGPRFRDIDFARLELLCELTDDLDLNEDALAVIISLIDQLHTARSELRRVLSVVQEEHEDVRQRVAQALVAAGGHQ